MPTLKISASGFKAAVALLLLTLLAPLTLVQADPNQGPGGPILVVTNGASNFGRFYAEILRTEGFNEFSVADIGTVTATTLNSYDVVILAKTPVSSTQATMFTNWVTAGGNLIAMDPPAQLAGLLGITQTAGTLANGYVLVNNSTKIGAGIVNQTIQYHGSAQQSTLSGAASLATLYSNASTPTAYPAVTLRSVGANGGQAAAFMYDLATSIVYTRQGNPAWATGERDGIAPTRSSDKFYGAAPSDPQPNWIDLSKVAIPQADEQQRFLANLITEMNLDRKPLPRFWYLPNGHKAAIVMTGDDHANNGTTGRFNQFIAASPQGCSVDNWECVRGTSYLWWNTPMSDAQAAAFEAAGFEIGLHVNTGCSDYTQSSLEGFYTDQIAKFQTNFPSVPSLKTQRHHCIVFSDWASGPKVQLNHGMRLDANYYYWPPGWVNNVPGHFSGSAMPMRFADLDGTLIDVYQAVTQMTDESGQEYPFTVDTLLDRAIGTDENYGVYTINAHTDVSQIVESDTTIESAQARGVPIVSARQMLTWLDGRNNSTFAALAWANNVLSFNVTQATGANGLRGLVPFRSANRVLSTLTRGGADVPFEVVPIKGVEYAAFAALTGSYAASYLPDATAPAVVNRVPAAAAAGVGLSTVIQITFSEALDASTVTTSSIELRNELNAIVPASVSYNANNLRVTLVPNTALVAGSTYTVTVRGGASDPRVKDLAGNAMAANASWSFATAPPITCPCSIWDASAVPSVASESDNGAVELGVKFRSDTDGYIKGIRFYKGPANTGTHVGNLWSSSGQLLATATFVDESAAGWQQVLFAAPVPIVANTTYVASYYAPNGGYAATGAQFATAGVTNQILQALSGPVAGGNGVFAYGSGGVFPNSSWNNTNYWVDVVFDFVSGGAADTAPPSISITDPTTESTFATASPVLSLSGTASDNNAVTQVTWSNDRGGSGTAIGSTAWSIATINLLSGVNTITVTARDASNNTSADSLVVTYAPPPDTTSPTISVRTPNSGSSGVSLTATVSVTFSEAIDPATINASTIELRNAANALVASNITYNAGSMTATLTPASALATGTSYTVTVKGGATDPRVKDVAGNALAATSIWSFTTTNFSTVSLWTSATTPSVISDGETNSVELGVKFRSDVAGYITGVRFYKGPLNTGTHTGSLWTEAGQLLGSVTFSNETASGWQQADFASPISIAANTTYVASYFAPNGRYSYNANYFVSGTDSGVLHAPASVAVNGNGVYAYGAGGVFPTNTYGAANYWVDVAFAASIGPDTTPPTITGRTPVSSATNVATNTPVTVSFSEPMDASSTTSSTFELRTAGNVLVPATVSYAGTTATLVPTTALANSSTYTVTVRGGASGVKDSAGNALLANDVWSFTTAAPGGPCAANTITAENCLTGNPASEWDISGAGDPSIQGFATQISVNRGTTVSFKVNTNASNYRFDIYRMGYYGGLGARKVATVSPSATLPQTQPSCLTQPATGLIDCGNWTVSGSWSVPSNATSGIYFAKVIRTDTGGASHIVFIVRNDASTSDLVFQTSDTTWQAYNNYGGNSLYMGSPGTNPGRAYKVSYNRPFNTRAVDGGQDWVFNSEYPMVRWLEANGYDVTYITGVDSDRTGASLLNHRVFLSVGHDEYWSATQRSNVEAARAAGVSLAFFSGNEVFWKTRWENSIDGSGAAYRTLVCYKETHAGAKIDPTSEWTGTWRDPRFSPPSDGGRGENALTGTLFTVNTGTAAIQVPAAEGKMRLWRNTSIATLTAGQVATLPAGTLGYEWDSDLDNGFRPAGLVRLSDTTVSGVDKIQDYGSTYASGTANHALTLYKHSSGARVFGAGTIQWTWGLDATHDRAGTPADVRMQQATVNLLADMNAQPATLQTGLVAASASSDTVAPIATIAVPASGSAIGAGSAFAVSGTAADTGGGVVGGVEVSTDGGTSWHPAVGRTNWTYSWVPTTPGAATIRVRAVDDSGNLQASPTTVAVTVNEATCPCSIWPASSPSGGADIDPSAVELGTRFRSSVDGTISAIRFYKVPENTGTHVGSLWSSTGTLLGQVTFSGESASGWQTAPLATPVAITANTWYVVSYHTSSGAYSGEDAYFALSGVTSGPLYAAQDGEQGSNGLYKYSSTSTFPDQTYNSENYWVDVVFNKTAGSAGTDSTAPAVVITSPTSASSISTTTASISIGGTASDAVGVTQVSWTNDRGGSGTASGTSSWSASGIALQAGANVLTVTARDAAGNTGTRTLTVTYNPPDTTAPVVTITSPTSATTLTTSTTPLTLGGTASDAVGVTQVSWANNRGGSGTATGTTTWSAASIALLSGSNVLTVTARDAAGNTSTDTLTVTYNPPDTTAPVVTIATPTSATTYATNASTMALGGTASDSVGVTQVTWSNSRGGSGTATGATNWSVASIALQTGSNVLTVTARDAAGNTSTDTLTVTRDNTAPTVTITGPTSSTTYATSSSTISLSGSASDAVGVSLVSWSNSRGGSGNASGTTSWSVSSISLLSGSNVLTVTVRDTAGNTSTDTLTVTYTPDTTAPQVTITSPTSNSSYATSLSSINLGGTASDSVGVTQVSWSNSRGGSGTATGTTSWSVTGITLQSGSNTLTVTARDAAGNTRTDTLTVTYTPDTTQPTVTITSPTSNPTMTTTASSINIGGTASDNVGVTQVTWSSSRGGSGTATGTTTWSSTGVPILTGSNVITVTARDAAGNTRTDTLTVTR